MPPACSARRCSPWTWPRLIQIHRCREPKGCLCDAQCVGFALCGVALGVAVLPAASQTATAVLSRTLLKRRLSQQQLLAVRPAAPCPDCTICAMPAQQPLSCLVVLLGHGLPSTKATEQQSMHAGSHCQCRPADARCRAAMGSWGRGWHGPPIAANPRLLAAGRVLRSRCFRCRYVTLINPTLPYPSLPYAPTSAAWICVHSVWQTTSGTAFCAMQSWLHLKCLECRKRVHM